MQAKGNGNKEVCVQNLLSLYSGSVPYARAKGINAENINRPISTVMARLTTETRKMIEKYEPRVEVTNAEIKAELIQHGYIENIIQIGGINE